MRTDNRSARGRGPVNRRRARRISRGQALVEFAMVVPLFLLMIFGFVEIALITASIAGFNFAAKDAARLGSFDGRNNLADQDMFKLIQSRVTGVVVAKLVEVEIFKSDAGGDYILPGNTGPLEDAYDANFTPIGTLAWPATSRNDTLLDADYLGVRLTYQYTYLTAYLSGGASTLTLTANSVQRIEPQDFQSHVRPPAWLAMVSMPRASASVGPSGAALGETEGIATVSGTPEADVRRQTQTQMQAQAQAQAQAQKQTRAWGGAA